MKEADPRKRHRVVKKLLTNRRSGPILLFVDGAEAVMAKASKMARGVQEMAKIVSEADLGLMERYIAAFDTWKVTGELVLDLTEAQLDRAASLLDGAV